MPTPAYHIVKGSHMIMDSANKKIIAAVDPAEAERILYKLNTHAELVEALAEMFTSYDAQDVGQFELELENVRAVFTAAKR